MKQCLTLEKAVSEISGMSLASISGFITVYRGGFLAVRHNALPSSVIKPLTAPGDDVARVLLQVQIPVLSKERGRVILLTAANLDGKLQVERVEQGDFILFSIKGDVEDSFSRRWYNPLSGSCYHYSYHVITNYSYDVRQRSLCSSSLFSYGDD